MKATASILDLYEHFISSTGVSTDTRTLEEGDLFFALKGPNFNGNQYAAQALEKGASYVIVDEEEYANHDRALLVSGVLEMMQALAMYYRQRFDIPVLAITGSNGKTTTKELCLAALSQEMKAYGTQGNLNNHIGVPLTLLRMPEDTEIAIIEMGDNKMGDITELCHIALPTHGVVTNVGKDHLEGFGDFDANVRAKSELFQYLSANRGVAFVNSADTVLRPLGARLPKTVWYGRPQDRYHLVLLSEAPFVRYKAVERSKITTRLFGRFNFDNLQTAYAIAKEMGMVGNTVNKALSEYEPRNNRSQVVELQEYFIVLDAYNANPSSMEASLRSFAKMEVDDLPRLAILGDMLELGKTSEEEHLKLIELAQSFDMEIMLCGELLSKASKQVEGFEGAVFATREELLSHLRNNLPEPCAIFVKGSRGMALEAVVEVLDQ